jgi:hypothetical protein
MTLGGLVIPNAVRDSAKLNHYRCERRTDGDQRIQIIFGRSNKTSSISDKAQVSELSEILGEVLEKFGFFEVFEVCSTQSAGHFAILAFQ